MSREERLEQLKAVESSSMIEEDYQDLMQKQERFRFLAISTLRNIASHWFILQPRSANLWIWFSAENWSINFASRLCADFPEFSQNSREGVTNLEILGAIWGLMGMPINWQYVTVLRDGTITLLDEEIAGPIADEEVAKHERYERHPILRDIDEMASMLQI